MWLLSGEGVPDVRLAPAHGVQEQAVAVAHAPHVTAGPDALLAADVHTVRGPEQLHLVVLSPDDCDPYEEGRSDQYHQPRVFLHLLVTPLSTGRLIRIDRQMYYKSFSLSIGLSV